MSLISCVREKVLFDYTDSAARYWFSVVFVGLFCLAISIWHLAADPRSWGTLTIPLWVLASWLCTRLSFRVSNNRPLALVLGDFVTYLALLYHGTYVAVICAAIDGFFGSRNGSKRISSHVFSLANSSLAIMLASLCLTDAAYDSIEMFTLLLTVLVFVHWAIQTGSIWIVMNLKKQHTTLRQMISAAAHGFVSQVTMGLFAGLNFLIFRTVDRDIVFVVIATGLGILAAMGFAAKNAARKAIRQEATASTLGMDQTTTETDRQPG